MPAISSATLTCPQCGSTQKLEMPADACQFFHQCLHCLAVIHPEPGACCVFCSYADVPCPPNQLESRIGQE